jgi:hypothetical protein
VQLPCKEQQRKRERDRDVKTGLRKDRRVYQWKMPTLRPVGRYECESVRWSE